MSADFEELARERIACTARWLSRQAGWALPELADLEQQLWSCLLDRQAQFDPRRAPLGAFITMVLRRCAANLLRDRLALYRRTGHVYSLDQSQAGRLTGEPDLAAVVTRREYDARRRYEPGPDRDREELNQDVARVLGRLPVELCRTARALQQARSKAEAARQLGIPPNTFKAQGRRLRQCFEQAGLHDYL